MIALAGILAGDSRLYETAIKSKGGKQKVCRVLERRDERLLKPYRNMESLLKKSNEIIAEKDKTIEEITKAREEDKAESEETTWLEAIKNIMDSLKYTAEQAMDALKIPKENQAALIKKLL